MAKTEREEHIEQTVKRLTEARERIDAAIEKLQEGEADDAWPLISVASSETLIAYTYARSVAGLPVNGGVADG